MAKKMIQTALKKPNTLEDKALNERGKLAQKERFSVRLKRLRKDKSLKG